MSTITKDLKEVRQEMYENTRSLEKSLYHNTQATYFLALAMEGKSTVLREKVKEAEEQLTKHESERSAQETARRMRGESP